MIDYLRKSLIGFCITHTDSKICVQLFLIILSSEEKKILREALDMIEIQRNFKRVSKI